VIGVLWIDWQPETFRLGSVLVLLLSVALGKAAAETVVLSGTVSGRGGLPVQGAAVGLVKIPDITVLTGRDGHFSIQRDILFQTPAGDTVVHRPDQQGFLDTLQVSAAGYYPLDTPLVNYTASYGALVLEPLQKSGGMVLIPSAGHSFPKIDTNNLIARTGNAAIFHYCFWMDSIPVTQGEFQTVMRFNPSFFKGDGSRPVERVSWRDAVRYCLRKSVRDHLEPCYDTASGWKYLRCDIDLNGYRLPDDVEWQFSAKGGMVSRYYWGYDTNTSTVSRYVWDLGNSGKQTHPVAQKLPNRFGLYDMIGNVWSWCYNNDVNYDSAAAVPRPIDPYPASVTLYRVIRGASWSNYYDILRPHETRGVIAADYHSYCLGFRCVRTAQRAPGE
jgi:formylglycine-generating enzyme required for sulfatase activity